MGRTVREFWFWGRKGLPNFPRGLVPSRSSFVILRVCPKRYPQRCSELDPVGWLWRLVWNRAAREGNREKHEIAAGERHCLLVCSVVGSLATSSDAYQLLMARFLGDAPSNEWRNRSLGQSQISLIHGSTYPAISLPPII